MTGILKRGAIGASFPLFVLVVQASATVTTACGDSDGCKATRDSTYASLTTWEECDPKQPDPCIVEPGNPKDCTGVLACTFAINPIYRSEAEEAVLAMGEQSRGCYQCATPACGNGATAYCEPVSHRCMLLSTSFTSDAGGASATNPGSVIVVDAGGD